MVLNLSQGFLEKLCSGDAASAEQAFLVYAPYLRIVVRRKLSQHLRTNFDSVDIVQSVWANVLQGFREGRWRFADGHALRAFLVRAALNRLCRRQRDLRRERPLSPADLNELPHTEARHPGDTLQAEELWTQLIALCPPAHRDLLELKRQGLSLQEIATRTGLHTGSVRRILYDLARRFGLQRRKDSLPRVPPW